MKPTYIDKQEHLPKCFNCDGSPIVFVASNGKFSIRCQKCNVRTIWEKKSSAIIDWFLFHERGTNYYATYKRKEKQAQATTA